MTDVFGPDGRRLKKITSTGTTLDLGAGVERAGTTWIKYVHADAKIIGTDVSCCTNIRQRWCSAKKFSIHD
jgi:hypothetical protein